MPKVTCGPGDSARAVVSTLFREWFLEEVTSGVLFWVLLLEDQPQVCVCSTSDDLVRIQLLKLSSFLDWSRENTGAGLRFLEASGLWQSTRWEPEKSE